MDPLIIGHRGASALAPENTLAAFRLAQQQGADGIEFDVQLTSDGVPVVIHDYDLQRTASISKLVAEVTLSAIRTIDVGTWFNQTHEQTDPTFALERIPTLEEVLEIFETTQALLYLEMKSETKQRERLAQSCCDLLANHSLKDQVVIECFDHAAIAHVKKIDPEIKTAALFEPNLSTLPLPMMGSRIVSRALAVNADQVALHHRLAKPSVIHKARQAGLGVAVWTVDEPKWIVLARANNIDALIANDPGKLIRERDRPNSD